jgi:hypothetical protein
MKIWYDEIDDTIDIQNKEYILNESIPYHTIMCTINKMLNYECNDYEILIMLNIKKLNDSWQLSDNYIDTYNNLSFGKLKYINSRFDLINFNIEEPPYIYRNDTNNIEFYNGRHRFSNLRDIGIINIPCIIDKCDIDFFNIFI